MKPPHPRLCSNRRQKTQPSFPAGSFSSLSLEASQTQTASWEWVCLLSSSSQWTSPVSNMKKQRDYPGLLTQIGTSELSSPSSPKPPPTTIPKSNWTQRRFCSISPGTFLRQEKEAWRGRGEGRIREESCCCCWEFIRKSQQDGKDKTFLPILHSSSEFCWVALFCRRKGPHLHLLFLNKGKWVNGKLEQGCVQSSGWAAGRNFLEMKDKNQLTTCRCVMI